MTSIVALLVDCGAPTVLLEEVGALLRSAELDDIRLEVATLSLISAGDLTQSRRALPTRIRPDVALICLPSDAVDGAQAFFKVAQTEQLDCPIIAAVEEISAKAIGDLLQQGIEDYVVRPFRGSDLFPRLWRFTKRECGQDAAVQHIREKLGLRQIVGESTSFANELKKLPAIAACDATVLVTGETGTGKEIFARSIHYLSKRAAKPFVAVNSGAIPADLLENELFGHLPGAFTGADSTRCGLVQEANEGTLFLDEIDSVSLSVQGKLLRLLQEKEYRPLGSAKVQRADVRIIAASNNDLARAAVAGTFRQDLYYRLNVVPITLPPLRERPEDIATLARHFLLKYREAFEKPITGFASAALRKLALYNWPGNVRELENIVERAVIFCEQTIIRPEDISLPIDVDASTMCGSFRESKAKAIGQFEKAYITELLIANGGNISKAARAAQKNRRAFWELIRKNRITDLCCKPTSLNRTNLSNS